MRIAVAGATGRVERHVVAVLEERGHGIVPISRRHGVDVVTREGLAAALVDVDCIIDVATTPSADEHEATEYFVTATRHLHESRERAGVQRMVVVSIIGIDPLVAGYSPAKLAHERAALAGPIPTRIVRAAQFHEFVEVLVGWGRRATSPTCRECAPSWSPHGMSPRCWSTRPPPQSSRPTRRSGDSPRSPAHGRKASSLLPNCSPLTAATR